MGNVIVSQPVISYAPLHSFLLDASTSLTIEYLQFNMNLHTLISIDYGIQLNTIHFPSHVFVNIRSSNEYGVIILVLVLIKRRNEKVMNINSHFSFVEHTRAHTCAYI